MKKLFLMLSLVVMLGCIPRAFQFIDTKNITRIGWSSVVIDRFEEIWNESERQNVEFALCLYGYADDPSLYVIDALDPISVTREARDFTELECEMDTEGTFLGIAHTHPSGYSDMSDADARIAEKFPIMVIICGVDCRTIYFKNRKMSLIES